MKNKTTTVAVLALLAASLVLDGCVVNARGPRIRPLADSLSPVDTSPQLERQSDAVISPRPETVPAS